MTTNKQVNKTMIDHSKNKPIDKASQEACYVLDGCPDEPEALNQRIALTELALHYSEYHALAQLKHSMMCHVSHSQIP